MHATRTLLSHRGQSLAEVSIVLMVLSLVGAVVSPVIGDYVSDARQVKAAADVRVLAVSVARFAFDAQGDPSGGPGWKHLDLLVGEGTTPLPGPGGDAAWLASPDSGRVGALTEHLVTNTVHYPATPGLAVWARGWRGPYVASGVGPDPWGHRYAISLGEADVKGPVLVLSAGPNGRVETAFSHGGVVRGGDDIIAIVGSGGSQ
jgi:type II secretory pathway pseudopilin PulG